MACFFWTSVSEKPEKQKSHNQHKDHNKQSHIILTQPSEHEISVNADVVKGVEDGDHKNSL